MKAYIIASGTVFGLLALVHVARLFFEGLHVATDPFFLMATLVAAGFSVWAWRLLRLATSQHRSQGR